MARPTEQPQAGEGKNIRVRLLKERRRIASLYGGADAIGSGSHTFQLYVARARQRFGRGEPGQFEDDAQGKGNEKDQEPEEFGARVDRSTAEAEVDNGETNILTARARRDIRAATVAVGKARLRLLKKTHATE